MQNAIGAFDFAPGDGKLRAMTCPRCQREFEIPRPAHGHEECPLCGVALESCCDGGRTGPGWADSSPPPASPPAPSASLPPHPR